MTGWLILVDHNRDLGQGDTPHKVMSVTDYLSNPTLFADGDDDYRPSIINLSRSYGYQTAGYYASLLAEARLHRVVPNVQTMLELSRKGLYSIALPELNDRLRKAMQKLAGAGPAEITFFFGQTDEPGFEGFGRLLFDWFRAPILRVHIDPNSKAIEKLRPLGINRLDHKQRERFLTALRDYTKRIVSREVV